MNEGSLKSERMRSLLLLGGGSLFAIAALFLGGPAGKKLEPSSADPWIVANKSGLPGTVDREAGVFRVSVPRPNLKVSIGGTSAPVLDLEARATVSGSRDHALAIGDVPVTESEVPAALRSAIANGFNVTALHNRFMQDTPRIMSLHFTKVGAEERLAHDLGAFLGPLVRGPLPDSHFQLKPVKATGFAEDLMKELLWKGELHGSTYRVSMGFHTELSTESLGRSTGVTSWAEFSGSKELAIVNGEIAIIEPELREILKSLLDSGMQVVSVHEHLTEETPKLSFVHFLGQGPLKDLAEGVKKAVEIHGTHTSK